MSRPGDPGSGRAEIGGGAKPGRTRIIRATGLDPEEHADGADADPPTSPPEQYLAECIRRVARSADRLDREVAPRLAAALLSGAALDAHLDGLVQPRSEEQTLSGVAFDRTLCPDGTAPVSGAAGDKAATRQQWKMVGSTGDGAGTRLVHIATGKCLTARKDAPAELTACTGAPHQMFRTGYLA